MLHRSISGLILLLLTVYLSDDAVCQLYTAEESNIDTSEYFASYYPGWLDYNLMIAASKGYPSEIERLVKLGADINATTYEGATPLIFAVSSGKPEAVNTILSFNPEIDKITSSFENPLLIAVKNQFFEISELLIRAGADVDYNDNHGATPLHYASLYGYPDITDLLLYYEAQPNPKADDGSTPLHTAAWTGNVEIADILLQNGALPDERDNKGLTPLLISSYYGDTLLMEILRKKGADIYARNNDGDNALTIAIRAGSERSIRYLLPIGDRWAEKKENAVDPFTIAAKYGRKDILELLRENHIPGRIKYNIDQVSLNLSSRFTGHDFSTGISLVFKEPLLNIGIITGVDIKPWYTRVLLKESDSKFYQYMDKGSLAYAGFFKEFCISEIPDMYKMYLSAELLGGYSFGNNLKGTFIVPENKFRLIPALSLNIQYAHFKINAGAEYLKTDFHKVGPVWLRFGFGYNYYFDNLRKKIKQPKWF